MKTFAELDLIEPVQRALAEEKYLTPTPIQAQTVPAGLLGRDVLGCAQTGTGKTAAFALPLLNHLGKQNRKARPNRPLVLVLAPTRELAIQIEDSFATYGRHLRLRQVLVYGGVSPGNQIRALNRGAHILVATPGRLLDLMNQGHIDLSQLEAFVLDEADRMLDMGFLPDLKRIISQLPTQRQSLFFSATMPPKIIELAKRLLTNPVNVNVTPKLTSVEKIEQQVFFVERNSKQALLRQILRGADADRALVFTKTKRGANILAGQLLRSGISSAAIHGNKSQNARQRALEAFRCNEIQVLVATDVAARGIDIDGITHVVNFDLPIEPEAYVHRIGRTGRAGAAGVALSFCSAGERGELRAIEQLIGQKVPLAPGQKPPERREQRPSSSRPREGVSPRHASNGSASRKPTHQSVAASRDSVTPRSGAAGRTSTAVRSTAVTEASSVDGADRKPKRRRRRRKGPNTTQRVEQTN